MRPRRFSIACLAASALAACQAVVPNSPQPQVSGSSVQPTHEAVRAPGASPEPTPERNRAGPTTFVFAGELEQGGWIRGQAPGGTRSARLGETDLVLDEDGRFFAGIDRDAGAAAVLVARLADGREVRTPLAIAPRAWDIERVNVAKRPGGMSDTYWRNVREPEWNRIQAARARDSESRGWAQDFIWPVRGRISGRFGAQRIYRGEPGSYHTGLDIAPGAGTPFVAPADGVVTLAATEPFSLEGHLVILDHGQGLNSAFLHAASIDVREGDRVVQGQRLGTVGATGRATGPHLHWSIKWRDARLDPLLFLDR